MAVQTVVSLDELPVATAITLFSSQTGAAIFLTVAQAAILSELLPRMQTFNPAISKKDLVQAGATGLKDLVERSRISEVLDAYADSVASAFYVAAAIMAAAAVVAFGVEWKRLKRNDKKAAKSADFSRDGAAPEKETNSKKSAS